MAQPSNSFSSYDAVGNREDLTDIIDMISPYRTPVLSMIPRAKAKGTKHEWQVDALAAASGSNWVIEGDDATTDATVATTRVYNYTGIGDKVPRVTGTQEEVNKAGRKSEMSREIVKKSRELKTDVETQILQNNASVAGNDTTARQVAGLQAWIKTNTNIASDSTASTGDGTDIHTDGTARDIQEAFVEDVLAKAWTSGGEPTLGIMNAFQKRKFAAFNGNSTPMSDGDNKKVVNSVDIYIDPLGNEVKLMPDHFAPTDVVFFLDPQHLAFAPLRDFHSVQLAKTGDTIRKQILVEWTLEVGNEAAHAGIYDLTTS